MAEHDAEEVGADAWPGLNIALQKLKGSKGSQPTPIIPQLIERKVVGGWSSHLAAY